MFGFYPTKNKGKQIGSFFTSRINFNIFRFISYARKKHTVLLLLVDFTESIRSFPIFHHSFRWYQAVKKICAILVLR